MKFKTNFLILLKQKNNGNYSDLSKEINIPKTTISGWINKSQIPRADHLLTLSRYFDVSCDFLLGKSEDMSGFEQVQSIYSRYELELLYKLKKLSERQLELVDDFILYILQIENELKN